MPSIPESTKSSLHQRLTNHAREHWPALATIAIRFRAGFAYIDGVLPDGAALPLCRLRYASSASMWGFAIYRASHEDYEDSYLPTGSMGGTQGQFKVDRVVMLLPSRPAEPLMDWCRFILLEHECTVEAASTPTRLPKARGTPSR